MFIDWNWFSVERCGPWASCSVKYVPCQVSKDINFDWLFKGHVRSCVKQWFYGKQKSQEQQRLSYNEKLLYTYSNFILRSIKPSDFYHLVNLNVIVLILQITMSYHNQNVASVPGFSLKEDPTR